jgi:PhzF family phenazine biosynthesis protein
VDAFAERQFSGNPAAVCPVQAWPGDALMQAIAAENNLSETAFLLQAPDRWRIRWFTPAVEVDLCGHATLASAAVVARYLAPGVAEVTFDSRSGPLRVSADGDDRFVLHFPARPPRPSAASTAISAALGARPGSVWLADYHMAVFDEPEAVRRLCPDMAAVAALGHTGLIATAPGVDVDFVSRFFAPAVGVPEDPVTGSAHCTLIPYWAQRLGRDRLVARQLSPRGGLIHGRDRGAGVEIGGRAVHYLRGHIEIQDLRR